MIRHSDYIHLPNFFSGAQSMMGALHSQVDNGFQILSAYMRYNELTLGGAVITINLASIAVSERIMTAAYNHFKKDYLQTSVVRTSAAVISAMTGICAVNHLLKLQLSYIHIVASVALTILLRHVWKSLQPAVNARTVQEKANPEKQGLNTEPGQKKTVVGENPVLDEGADQEDATGLMEAEQEIAKKLDSPRGKAQTSAALDATLPSDDPAVLDDEIERGTNTGRGAESVGLSSNPLHSSGGIGSMLKTGPLHDHLQGLEGF